MCYDEGHLLAYLDGELTASERAEVATHLSACDECAGQLERLAADRDVAADALGKLQPVADVVPLPAPTARQDAPAASRVHFRWTQVAAAVAAVLVIGSFAFAPVRSAGANLLQVFRVQKVQTVTFSEADLQSIGTALEKGGHVDLKSFGEAWIDGAASKPTTVTLAEAQAVVDFPVKLPADQATEPALTLQKAQTYKFKLHVDAINEALKSYGSDRTLPAALDGKVFSVSVPAILVARYPVPGGTITPWPAGQDRRHLRRPGAQPRARSSPTAWTPPSCVTCC